MRVVIVDIAVGNCELSNKRDVECVRVQLSESAGELVCLPTELLKLLRLVKKQESHAKPLAPKGLQS